MEENNRVIYEANFPEAKDGARMLLSFSDTWNADGISTIFTDLIKGNFGAERVAGIKRESFYRDFFSRKRRMGEPYAQITNGVLTEYSQGNDFYYAPNENMLIFQGAEPDMKVDDYCDCLLEVAQKLKVGEMYVGGSSFSQLLPPTREPKVFSFVSDESLKERIRQCNVNTEQSGFYTGSIVEYLVQYSKDSNIRMGAVIVEVPVTNIIFHPSVLKLAKTMGALLDLSLDLFDLEEKVGEIKKDLNELIEGNCEAQEIITEREKIYDEAMAQRKEREQFSRLFSGMPKKGQGGEPDGVDLN